MPLNEATKKNLQRKSAYVDVVQLHEGVPLPSWIDLSLTELCNRSAGSPHACVPAGTLIACLGGEKPIEQVGVGTLVFGADGKLNAVRETMYRVTNDLYEIVVGGCVVRATGEHPILTQDGWKQVSEIRPGRDSAVVRLRLWETHQMAVPQATLGEIHLEACPDGSFIKIPTTVERSSTTSTRAGSAPVQLWLWAVCRTFWMGARSILGRLYLSTSACKAIQKSSATLRLWVWSSCSKRAQVSKGSSTSFGREARTATFLRMWMRIVSNMECFWGLLAKVQVAALLRQTTCSNFKENAGQQSHEGSGDCKKSTSCKYVGSVPDQGGSSIFALGEGTLPSNKFSGRRQIMGKPAQPRFPSKGAKEGFGDNYSWDIQWAQSSTTNATELRQTDDTALCEEWVGLSGSILPRVCQKAAATRATPSVEGLLLAGIKLERGLALHQIEEVRFIPGTHRVYNVECPPGHTYIANGVVVHNCSFCPRIDRQFYPNQNLHMSLGLAERIGWDLATLDYQGAIVLCGYGEPLLHPRIFELVTALRSRLPKARIEIVTNGDFLGPEKIGLLYAAGVNYFVVSMYDGEHQVQRFHDLFAEALGRAYADDVYLLRDRWHTAEDQFGLKLTNRGGTVLVGPQEPVDTHRPCHYLAYQMQVDWNGDVVLCPQDWHKRLRFGNLGTERLFDIWTSPRMKKRRQQLLSGQRVEHPCSQCNTDGTLHGFNHVPHWVKK